MIDLHYWTTPNGHKITIFLEETGLKYRIVPVNIGIGEQFRPEFLAISPNNRMPAIIDHEPGGGGKEISLFQSRGDPVYLSRKSRKILPGDLRGPYQAIPWPISLKGGFCPLGRANFQFNGTRAEKESSAV